MGLFGKSKKEMKLIMYHYDGLPGFRKNAPCNMFLDEDNCCLRFELFASKDNTTIELPLIKITKTGSVSLTEIEEQSKVGRAFVGGLLFGNAGAIVGALSAGEKKKIKSLYIINYVSDNEEKVITLEEKGNINYFKFQKRLTELLPEQERKNVSNKITL